MAFDPFEVSIRVEVPGGYFAEVDRGYVAYGLPDNHTVERLSHFGDRDEFSSLAAVRAFLEQLVCSVRATCPSIDRERLAHDCTPNPGGYCSACGAGRDHS